MFFNIAWGWGCLEVGNGELGSVQTHFLNPLRISCTIQCFFSEMSQEFLTSIVV